MEQIPKMTLSDTTHGHNLEGTLIIKGSRLSRRSSLMRMHMSIPASLSTMLFTSVMIPGQASKGTSLRAGGSREHSKDLLGAICPMLSHNCSVDIRGIGDLDLSWVTGREEDIHTPGGAVGPSSSLHLLEKFWGAQHQQDTILETQQGEEAAEEPADECDVHTWRRGFTEKSYVDPKALGAKKLYQQAMQQNRHATMQKNANTIKRDHHQTLQKHMHI